MAYFLICKKKKNTPKKPVINWLFKFFFYKTTNYHHHHHQKQQKQKTHFNIALVSQVSRHVENFNFGIFLDIINVISVKLCMMVLYIEFYLFITLSVTFTLFQGHSSVKLFVLKMLCSYPVKLKFVHST